MKNILLLAIGLLISQCAIAQTESIDRLVRKMKRANRECERIDINIPGWLVRVGTNFVDEDDLDGVDIKKISRKISHLRIVTIEDTHTSDKADFQTFLTDIRKEGFDELMTVRSDGDNVRIMMQESKDFIRHFVILVSEKQGDFVMVSVEGKFTMDDINSVIDSSDVNINGKSVKNKSKKKSKTVDSED
jgi:hypothetical protein